MNICNRLLNKYGKSIRSAVRQSAKTGKEIGFFLCENGPSPLCIGEIDISHEIVNRNLCPNGTRGIGFFHTHPFPKRHSFNSDTKEYILNNMHLPSQLDTWTFSQIDPDKLQCVASERKMSCFRGTKRVAQKAGQHYADFNWYTGHPSEENKQAARDSAKDLLKLGCEIDL